MKLAVTAAQAGLRLDAFLVSAGLAPSAGAARRLLDQGAVRVDARRARKGQRLAAGQTVELAAAARPSPSSPPSPWPLPSPSSPPSPSSNLAPAVIPEPALPLTVLYQDAQLVALDKPAGWPSHPLRGGETGTLASALVARFPECAAASRDPREAGLVHRLDAGTSGAIVAARDPATWAALRRIVSGAGSEKLYVAEVSPEAWVRVPAGPVPWVVDQPIGRRGRRSASVRVGAGRGLLPARTELAVRARRAETWLVEARLQQGRAHQVRAHLGHVGLPVLGDPLYAPARARALAARLGVVGFRLHAWRLRFRHPTTGAVVEVQAPLPEWAT